MKFDILPLWNDDQGMSKLIRNIPIGSYEIDELPGCKRVGVSHKLQILIEFQKRGYGYKAMADRLDKARELGYKVLLATVVNSNKAQQKILRKFKWKEVTTWFNPTTGNDVTLWVRNLDDPYETDWIGGCR